MHVKMMSVRCGAVVVVALLSATGLGAAENALVAAVKSGNGAAARTLLKASADAAKVPAPDGTTPLHWAARSDDVELVGLLIAAGADVNVASRYGVRPLGLAAEYGNATIVDRLLKAGADPNEKTSVGGQTILMTAARAGRVNIVRTLLAHGANPNVREASLGQTALMWAAAEGHAAVVDALLNAGADASAVSNVFRDGGLGPSEAATPKSQWAPTGGMSALHFAARQGATDVVRVMADHHADLEQEDPDGMTPLLLAAFNGNFDTAALLLDKGANPNHYDHFGQSVLFFSADLNIVEDDGAAIGVRGGRPKTLDGNTTTPLALAKLALAKGADLNPRISKRLRRRLHYFGNPPDPVPVGATPLWRAARAVDLEFVKFLLAAGADPKAETSDARTTVIAAAGPELINYSAEKYVPIGTDEQRIAVLGLLLDAGVDVNKPNDRGETPLHSAAMTGQPAVTNFLLARGARLDVKDSVNRTPLDVAMGKDPRPESNTYSLLRPEEAVAAVLRAAMQDKGIPIEPWVPPAQGTLPPRRR